MLSDKLWAKINQKTKPLGALGQLEQIAHQIGMVQESLTPSIEKPTMVVLAADHGIAKSGVSAFPQEVTAQMVMNFLEGGAAINVFCRQNDMGLQIADVGVAYNFPPNPKLLNHKIAHGTRNFLTEAAMSQLEVEKAFEIGQKLVNDLSDTGCNLVGFGEMGIGNTSSASMLMHYFTNIPLAECVGKGTGLDDAQVQKKLQILEESKKAHNNLDTSEPIEVLRTFGGLEIATMCGAMIEAGKKNMVVLVDGFIATAAYLTTLQIAPELKQNAICCHQSDEQGHQKMLRFLGETPMLSLSLRLGEGTGVVLALPLIKSAVAFLNDMASFESAGVSGKEEV